MQNWHRHYRKPIFITLTLAAFTFLIAPCSVFDATPVIPSDLDQIDMSQTIERLQKIGPQLQQQLEQMETLNPNLGVSCSSAYPEKCIPPAPPDLDCEDITQRNFMVLPPDPHKFDQDSDGVGCEG
mgnify:CR=1 FL=1